MLLVAMPTLLCSIKKKYETKNSVKADSDWKKGYLREDF